MATSGTAIPDQAAASVNVAPAAAPVTTAAPTQAPADAQPISKTQRKKILKREAMLARRIELKEDKKKKRIEARKAAAERRAAIAAGQIPADNVQHPYKKKKEHLRRLLQEGLAAQPHPLRIVIDCQFGNQMHDRELSSLCQQLMYCYGSNARAPKPVQFYFTSFEGVVASKLKTIQGSDNWLVTRTDKSYLDTFPKEELVYLTSESPNVLKTLDPSKAYIIGGLVDHNRLKGITYDTAVKQGIAHAQLPIAEYIKMSQRKVLAVNHVVEIILSQWADGDWEQAFLKAIPSRKQKEIDAASSDKPAAAAVAPADGATTADGTTTAAAEGGEEEYEPSSSSSSSSSAKSSSESESSEVADELVSISDSDVSDIDD